MQEKYIAPGAVWDIRESVVFDRLTIGEGASYRCPDGTAAVMEFNGELRNLMPGTYEGPVTVRLIKTPDKLGEMDGPYRSALCFDENGLNPDTSALHDLLSEGTGSADGLDLTIRGNFLNGITCTGGTVSIENSTLRFLGNGDDFRLTGTAVAAAGNSDLTIRNCTICSEGIAATTVAAAGDADVLVDSCTLQGAGITDESYYLDNHHLTVVPWVLGLNGTVRASNVLERGTATYYNTDASCNGWGVLSVDGTKDATHNIINSSVTIPRDSRFASGYGAYLLGGTTSTFLGSTFDVPDYAFAVGGNDHHTLVGPSTQENLLERRQQLAHLDRAVGLSSVPERPCIIRAGKFAGMWHHQSTGIFDIRPGTEIHAGLCAFLIKSGERLNPPRILCDGASIDAPVLVHLMESDDPGMGTYGRDRSWAPYYACIYRAEGDPEFDLAAVSEDSVRVEFKNMTLSGNCYNTKWTIPQNLSLSFDHTSLSGTISSGTAMHRHFSWGIAEDAAGRQVCTDPDGRPYETRTVEDLLFGKIPVTYSFPVTDKSGAPVYAPFCQPLPLIGYALSTPELLGDVAVTACPGIRNGVIVSLCNGSVWTAAGHSYLNALTIDAASTLRGRLLVDGREITPLPGTYTGQLEVLPR